MDADIGRQVRRAALTYGAILALILIAACGGGASAIDAAQAERGGNIYAQKCQTCHGDAATGQDAVAGAPSHGPDGHTWHHADGQLLDIILGRLDYPGRTMPSFADALSDDQALDVLAYFKTSWEPAQRASQHEASLNWQLAN